MEVVRHGNPARNESPAGPQAPKPAGDAADNKSFTCSVYPAPIGGRNHDKVPFVVPFR
jgi:hypothetical protein